MACGNHSIICQLQAMMFSVSPETLFFSDSKSWKDSGTLIYENFDPSYIVPYSYHVNADSISLFPIHSSNTNDLKTYPFEKDLNKLILSLEDTDKHAVYKPQ